MPCISLALTIVLCIVISIIFYAIRKIIEKAGGSADGAKTAMSVISSIVCLGLWIWFFFGFYIDSQDACSGYIGFGRKGKMW